MPISLIIPAFFAGILTFLAPCTLPLVPGYLVFISGVSPEKLQSSGKSELLRGKMFINGVFFIIGFSLVFILLGSLFGLGGASLIKHRLWLSRIGGVFVILFGLFMLKIIRVPFLYAERKISVFRFLRPGNTLSSLVFGATFAFGWSPCVGPIVGSILALAASSATVASGALLLAVFSLGLALPFLAIAASVTSASGYLTTLKKYYSLISALGGSFLVFLGILLFTDNLGIWVAFFYRLFDFINYESLINYL